MPSARLPAARGAVRRAARRTVGASLASRGWTQALLADFTPADGDRDALVARLAPLAAALRWRALAWRLGRAGAADLAGDLLALCAAADDGGLWHRDLGVRSYVDASLQAKVLRACLERISPRSPLALAQAVVECRPDARPGLLVLGELTLEAGDAQGAIDVARQALRVQAVCMTAQDLLMRGYRLKRDQGSTDPELGALDFDLTDRFCETPFTHLSTGAEGDAFVCMCPAWVPYPVGNVYAAAKPEDIWNSAAALEIRRSILDGDYSYCSRTQCSFLLTQRLPHKDEVTSPTLRRYIDEHVTHVTEAPAMIELNHDPTCNLACPSCRTAVIAAPRTDRPRLERAAELVLLPLMRRSQGHAYISGGGEALSSPHFRSILRKLNRREFPELAVYLITNGLLLTPRRWDTLPDLEEMLAVVSVSVDAARPATYEHLRRPGKWHVLRRNLDYIGELRRTGRIPAFELNFVVQGGNFREMIEFADLAEEVGADRLWFQRLVNYGSYDAQTFARLDVASPRHPDHQELLGMLRTPRLRTPAVNMDMLLGLLPEFVASDEPLTLHR